jgi:hypothetical protein
MERAGPSHPPLSPQSLGTSIEEAGPSQLQLLPQSPGTLMGEIFVGRPKAGLMLIPEYYFRMLSRMYGINSCVFSHYDMSLVM